MVANSKVGIWQRMIDADRVDFPVEAAKAFLKFDFAPSDRRRMNELSKRVQSGQLSPEERVELDNYVRAGHVLALIQSKSRRALATAGLERALSMAGSSADRADAHRSSNNRGS